MSISIVTGNDAAANVAALPANICIYGPPGSQKTTDSFAAFTANGRCTAFAIPCEDGALKILASRGMPIPDHPQHTVKSWGQMQGVIEWLHKNAAGRYNAVVVDGFTPLSAYLYMEAEGQLKGSKNKFLVPTMVRQWLFSLREWIRMLGMHSVFIAHAEPPAVQDGVFYQGSFKCTPRSIVREYFGQLDTVLRVDHIVPYGQEQQRVC